MSMQPVTVEVAPTDRPLPGSGTQASPSTPQLSITRSTTSPSRLPLGWREVHLTLCSALRTAIVRTERSLAAMANSMGQELRPEFDATTRRSPLVIGYRSSNSATILGSLSARVALDALSCSMRGGWSIGTMRANPPARKKSSSASM